MTLSLQEISDRLEIEQLLVRYCYAIDQRDWEAYRSVFTEDAVIDDVSAGITDVDGMVEFLPKALERVKIAQHTISTTLLEIEGDRASARTICHCPMVVDLDDGQTQVFFQGLWYVDELVRTTGGWRISKRAERDYYAHNVPPGFSFQDE
jgi:ketosteroid isomerase-like protein